MVSKKLFHFWICWKLLFGFLMTFLCRESSSCISSHVDSIILIKMFCKKKFAHMCYAYCIYHNLYNYAKNYSFEKKMAEAQIKWQNLCIYIHIYISFIFSLILIFSSNKFMITMEYLDERVISFIFLCNFFHIDI